jgi:hypothetical protein
MRARLADAGCGSRLEMQRPEKKFPSAESASPCRANRQLPCAMLVLNCADSAECLREQAKTREIAAKFALIKVDPIRKCVYGLGD